LPHSTRPCGFTSPFDKAPNTDADVRSCDDAHVKLTNTSLDAAHFRIWSSQQRTLLYVGAPAGESNEGYGQPLPGTTTSVCSALGSTCPASALHVGAAGTSLRRKEWDSAGPPPDPLSWAFSSEEGCCTVTSAVTGHHRVPDERADWRAIGAGRRADYFLCKRDRPACPLV
jgi:hypothetical protein